MTPRTAIGMLVPGIVVAIAGIAIHAPAAPIAIGALLCCIAGGVGACVLEHRSHQ